MELRDYQVEALDTMLREGRTIYADPPGTGKTATTLNWIDAAGAGRTLIVAPLSVLYHWQRQGETWVPGRQAAVCHGAAERRLSALQAVQDGSASTLVINYDNLDREITALVDTRFDTVVFDEAHRLKNRSALVHKAAVKLTRRAERVAMVTGTPLLNSAEELWAILHLLWPKTYTSFWRWAAEHFEITVETYKMRQVRLVGELKDGHAAILRAQLGDSLIRRDIDLGLPPVVETTLVVELSPKEREAYSTMMEKFWMRVGGEIVQAPNAVSKIVRMRQLASGTFDDMEDPGAGVYRTKIKAAADLVKDLAPEQVVILCAFKATVYALAEAVGGAAYTGDQGADERTDIEKRFTSGELGVIVATHGALREGVDGLQVARNMIQLDLDWTPGLNEQAVARLHRSGQRRTVNVWRIIAKDTVDDDKIIPTLARKEAVISAVLDA